MDIKKTLQPGEMGTKQLLAQYGESLVCVRYQIDKKAQKRYTTVELIVDEKFYFSNTKPVQVWVKIEFNETELRQHAKLAGAKWNAEAKVWEMDYDTAVKLGLKKRIVKRMA